WCCRAASAIASARAAAGRLPQAVRLPGLLRRGAENRIGASDMRLWMVRFEQNAHLNPVGRSLLRLSCSAGGSALLMRHASCRPLRWYVPAATRREYVPVGSLMSSLTSNGRIRGVPTHRRKLRVADGFTSSRCGVIGGLGGRVVPTAGFQG